MAPEGGPVRTRSRLAARLDAAQAGLERGFATLLDAVATAPSRALLLVALVACLAALPGLGALPVTDRDEARFAQATKQMMESGDYVDIRFQDQPRWKKPIGIYWLQAAAAWPLGGPEAPIAAYRLPSFLAVVLAALSTWWAANALVGPRAAVLAGLAMATPVLAAAEATIAKTDAALLATAAVAFGALARGATGQAGRYTWLIFWLAIAAAVLLKGPIVPAIAALAVGALALARRAWPPLAALRPLPGLGLTALLVAPWLVAIAIVSDGAFFAEAVGRDLMGKVAEGQEAHWGPPGLYTALVWLTFWPAASLLPGALAAGWAAQPRPLAGVPLLAVAGRPSAGAMLLFLAAWAVPFWLVLEAVPTKLPHYVLPLYPALAVLVGWYASAPSAEPGAGAEPRWRARTAAALVAVPGVGLGLAALVLPLVLEGRPVALAALLGLAGGALALLAARAALAGQRLAHAAGGGLSALALYMAVLQGGLPALDTAFMSPRVAALGATVAACAEGPVTSLGYREPSLVFATATDTRLPPPPEAARILVQEPGTALLLVERWRPALRVSLADAGHADLVLVDRGSVTGFNYNRGRFETVTLVTRDDPRFDACAPALARDAGDMG